ncbi:uncharacterized protein TNCV_4391841 [Trichonephila clavipes]|nr:uncharacterized protein TNCV_4391841 [Trichonephila clavipes]
MALSGSLPQINLGVQGVTQGVQHRGAQRVKPEFKVESNFRIIPEQYFSGVENVVEFFENMDNNLTYCEIPTQLACAYLKGHLTGRALDWLEVLGYRVVEDMATDYAHLNQALSEQFPVVRNRSELETRFYSSSQKHNQKPSDFVYDLLKIHKFLKLEMTEEKLIDHIISRLDFGLCRGKLEGNESNNKYADNSRPRREFNRFESQGVDNQRFDGRRRGGKLDHRFYNQGGRQGGSKISTFKDIHYSPLGHGEEKSFISEEVYRKYFSYRPRQKTKDRVVTAQGAPCCHLRRVELQIRIREIQKTWEFHILNSMQCQCILGIDFMKESKLTLDFDQKSLIIPDNQIKQLQKMDKPVEIDLSDTKLGDGQNQKLRNLFNGFKGLFSDQPGLTHVLYHEIDTGDKGPVVLILPI